MKTFVIPEAVLTQIIQYLASKPYCEVAGAISALGQLQAVADETAPEKPGPSKVAELVRP